MSEQYPTGRILAGSEATIRAAQERMLAQAIDQTDLCAGDTGYSARRTTLGSEKSVTGSGTFYRRAQRTLMEDVASLPWR